MTLYIDQSLLSSSQPILEYNLKPIFTYGAPSGVRGHGDHTASFSFETTVIFR